MTDLTIERANFIEMVHQCFLKEKGFGAYAYVSVRDVMRLFDEFKVSEETANNFIQRYVKSI